MGWPEIGVLLVVGLLVFGPDKLPHMARQAGGFVRQIRQMAENAKNDLGQELGQDFRDLRLGDLDPRTAVRRALLDEPRPAATPRAGTSGTAAPFDPDAT
jgi:sec-independent protein translocase protein TatB